jgi:peptidoglycan/LPS O-acetylase OafA/YrhL
MFVHRNIGAAERIDYYPAFDYLRICLAIAVAASHAGLLSWNQAGNLPVQIFFALSGWLIGGILLRSKITNLPRFYFNRAARIWIPYLVAIVLLVVVSAAREPVTTKWLEFVFYKLTFVYDIFGPPQLTDFVAAMPLHGTGNHFWSICAEEQFYLLAPLLIIFLPIGRSIWFWTLLAVGIAVSPYANYFCSVSVGVLAAAIRTRTGDWQRSGAARISLPFLIVALFLATYFDVLPYQFLAPILSIAVVMLLAQPGAHSDIAEFIGGVSYPFYLNHWIGVFAAHAIFGRFGLHDSLASRVSSIFIAFAAACLLYLTIDRVIKTYRGDFFTPTRGKLAAVTGYALVSLGLIVGIALS